MAGSKPQKSLSWILDQLEKLYGRPKPPKITDPLGMILLENVAYLVPDERREATFAALRQRVGLKPAQILNAPEDVLFEIAKMGGMLPDQRVQKLRFIALTVEKKFQGDLRAALKLPPKEARKALKLFPGIGDPGAEKILLFSKTEPLLALDSHGLRVLNRLGFGEEQKNYAAMYRSAREAVKDQLRPEFPWLIRAHQLLRQHGREICKPAQPLCDACPLTRTCRFYRETTSSA